MIVTGLGEVAARGNAELDTQMLEQDRHKIGDHDDSQKRVAELGTARQIGGPVSWVHVTDRDQKSRARESDELPPERGCRRHDNTAMNFRQRHPTRTPAPGQAGLRYKCGVGWLS